MFRGIGIKYYTLVSTLYFLLSASLPRGLDNILALWKPSGFARDFAQIVLNYCAFIFM
jgi:hypothetical protein